MTNYITLDLQTLHRLSPSAKQEIVEQLGLLLTETQKMRSDGGRYAKLGTQAARAFLLGCSDKTTDAVRAIVNQGEEFEARQIEEQMGVQSGGLRGVWTGLTKRIRTITGDDEIDLFEWHEQLDDGSWKGRMMPQTRSAFLEALNG